MRRSWGWWAIGLIAVGVSALAGCKTDSINTKVPHVEEFTPPPDEERFNNPHEQGYKPPRPKKEFKPGLGGPSGPGSGGSGLGSN